eukprot:846206-Prymnesium_polylepis.2
MARIWLDIPKIPYSEQKSKAELRSDAAAGPGRSRPTPSKSKQRGTRFFHTVTPHTARKGNKHHHIKPRTSRRRRAASCTVHVTFPSAARQRPPQATAS